MANPNAVVSSVAQVEGNAVRLGNRQEVRLDPERPETRGIGPILAGMRDLRQPVYLEVDPNSGAITALRIPTVSRVVRMLPVEPGLAVELSNSHAAHILRRGTPDFEPFERELLDALNAGRVLIVTGDDAGTIIDVRAFVPGPDGDLPPLPPFPEPKLPKWPWPLRWLFDFLRWPLWPWWWFWPPGCVSGTRAKQIFDAMAATTCNPLTVPPPCVPFMFPDDGCWGRAHEMCRLMIAMNVTPKKVWIDAVGPLLKADTRNHPQCFVQWFWHVAPTICVRRWLLIFPFAIEHVIDPSLFTKPVTKAAWKAVQNNPNATLTTTDWTQFSKGGGTDPTFSSTNFVLATYRLKLQQRSQSSAGPPPYAYCP
jgi:hypothetical protein